MKYRIERDEELKEVSKIVIHLNDEDRYRITETIDGKLEISKYSDGLEECMTVFPRVTNVIDIK